MGKIVRYELDMDNPPPLTDAQKAELQALQARSDDDIDTSEIPELSDEAWENAVRKTYLRPVKQQLTLRLDADLIAWFKRRAAGRRGYQSDINKALREYVTEQQQKKAG